MIRDADPIFNGILALAQTGFDPPRKLAFQYVQQRARETLLDFLNRRFRYHTPAEWRQLIEQGHVTLDGRAARPEAVLQSRQVIAYLPPPRPEPEVDARYTVIHEDGELLAVAKSGNIPSTPSGRYWHNCLRHVLQRDKALPALHAVHRLDRETSGIIVFAKSARSARVLGEEFSRGRVTKTYVAVLRGHLGAPLVELSAPLRDAGGDVRIKQAVHPEGRPAFTRFRLAALLPGASLAIIVPRTGRTHQIRAHAAFLGHPVWGDRLYGVPEAAFIRWVSDPQRDLARRHLLHALTIEFSHPVTGQPLVLRAPAKGLLDAFWGASAGEPQGGT
jgi:RluA family pseudouridine synthase